MFGWLIRLGDNVKICWCLKPFFFLFGTTSSSKKNIPFCCCCYKYVCCLRYSLIKRLFFFWFYFYNTHRLTIARLSHHCRFCLNVIIKAINNFLMIMIRFGHVFITHKRRRRKIWWSNVNDDNDVLKSSS